MHKTYTQQVKSITMMKKIQSASKQIFQTSSCSLSFTQHCDKKIEMQVMFVKVGSKHT
jgi:hypothetical protein